MAEKEDNFVSSAEAVAILKVVPLTLHNWADKGKIDIMKTGGGHRRYNVDKYLRENIKCNNKEKKSECIKPTQNTNSIESIVSVLSFDSADSISTLSIENSMGSDKSKKMEKNSKKYKKENICYIRCVSTDDNNFLNAKRAYFSKKYPDYRIIEDTDLSPSYSGKGLMEIVEKAAQGKINNLVITENTNMSLYELDMLQHMIKTSSNGSIFIDKHQDNNKVTDNLIDNIIGCLEECVKKLADLKSNSLQ